MFEFLFPRIEFLPPLAIATLASFRIEIEFSLIKAHDDHRSGREGCAHPISRSSGILARFVACFWAFHPAA
jgi:hypothetical protein